ncbi:hypothetical protein NQ317_013620, partial [Molorchus minor]
GCYDKVTDFLFENIGIGRSCCWYCILSISRSRFVMLSSKLSWSSMFTVNGTTHGKLKKLNHTLLLNNTSEEPLFQGTDRTFLSAHVELPYPIHGPLKSLNPICKDIRKNRSQFKRCDKKRISKHKTADRRYMYIPGRVLDFYKERDPDPWFNCDYNYFYTGGVLEHLEINSEQYLTWCDVDNNIRLSNLRKSRDVKLLDYECTSPVFSIKSISDSGCNFLVLREKHHVGVCKLSDDTELGKLWSKEFKVPILDAKLNPIRPTHLGLVQCDLKVSIRDIEASKTVYRFKNSANESDNFQQFQFLNDSSIVLMDRFTVKVLDYRSNTNVLQFDPHLIKCNSMCNLGISGNDLLLASRHYLMKTDIRYMKDFSYYSHTLRKAPCFMDFTSVGDDTYMCLSSHHQGNKVLFTGKSPSTVPFKVPCIQDTLKQARLQNSSLVLLDKLDERPKVGYLNN